MKKLLLLHGALATEEQFSTLIPYLKETFELHRLTFNGHGSQQANNSFGMNHFVDQVIGYLDEQSIPKVNIFGYSMGGYVALTLAKKQPGRIKKVSTLGTILQWNKKVAEKECRLLNPKKMKEKIPAFTQRLDKQHPNGWEKVVDNTREMLRGLGQNSLIAKAEWKHIQIPVQLLVGDQDTTAGLEATVKTYKKLTKAQLGILPNTPHPFEKTDKELLSKLLIDYFQ